MWGTTTKKRGKRDRMKGLKMGENLERATSLKAQKKKGFNSQPPRMGLKAPFPAFKGR